MLVRNFKFKRINDKGGFPWTAHSEIEAPGFYRGFTAVGRTLTDVKEFATARTLVCPDWFAGTPIGDASIAFREPNANNMGR